MGGGGGGSRSRSKAFDLAEFTQLKVNKTLFQVHKHIYIYITVNISMRKVVLCGDSYDLIRTPTVYIMNNCWHFGESQCKNLKK